jgi:hypothetical protein
MTFEEFMQSGGDREEKLVVIYKVAPEKLSESYKGLLDAMTAKNTKLAGVLEAAFPDLSLAVYNWNNGKIPSELERDGADFV